MKKVGKLLIVGIIIITILQLLLFILKKEHKITYEITKNKTKFNITEIFKNNYYTFEISTKEKIFVFDVPNNTHKQKKIIKNIIHDKEANEMCIYPIIEKNTSEIICANETKSYSASLAKMNLTDLKNKINKQTTKIKNVSNKSKKEGSIEVYYKNIEEDEIYYIWNYSGFYQITNKKTNIKKLIKNDHYYNALGVQVDNLYLFFSYEDKHDYNRFFIIDLETFKEKEIKLKEEMSKDSYIQGIINKKIYLFDPDNLKQYEIDLEDESYKIIGNKKKNALDYQNGTFKKRNIYDFKNEIHRFDLTYPLNDEYKDKVKEMFAINNKIYYLMENGEVLVYYKINKKTVSITKNNNISTLVIANEKFCYLENDMLYCEKNGEKYPIVHYEEFIFNPLSRVFIANK